MGEIFIRSEYCVFLTHKTKSEYQQELSTISSFFVIVVSVRVHFAKKINH